MWVFMQRTSSFVVIKGAEFILGGHPIIGKNSNVSTVQSEGAEISVLNLSQSDLLGLLYIVMVVSSGLIIEKLIVLWSEKTVRLASL